MTSGRSGWRSFAVALIVLLVLILLRPFQNLPFVDDWVYAWPVEHWLKTGELKVLEYSGAVNLPQVLWGTLFTLPGGFSFAALRVSTFALALATLWGVYALIKELGGDNAAAKLGVATLAVYPIFFVLSFTFMTDVPFVASMIGASYFIARGLRRKQTWGLIVGAALISISVGLRFNGIALAGAMGILLLFWGGSWGRRGRFLLAIIPTAAMLFLMMWRKSHFVSPADISWVENSPGWRIDNIKYGIPLLPSMLPAVLSYLAGDVGIGLLPAACAIFRRELIVRALILFVIITAMCGITHRMKIGYVLPLQNGETWALDELGATQPLVPALTPFNAPRWVYWTAAVVGWASLAVALAALWRRPTPVEWFLIVSIALTVLMMALLWLLYDRYALPIVVLLTVLVLARQRELRVWRAVPVLAVFALVSLVGTRDHLKYNAALWAGVQQLRELGAKDVEIVGGYTVNGWLQYAHPENAPRDETGAVMVPWVNSDQELRYQISNKRLKKGKVVGVVRYSRWMGRSGELYLVDHGVK